MDQEQLQELRELVEFLKSNTVAEFDMERPDLKVRIKFAGAPSAAALAGGVSLPAVVEAAVTAVQAVPSAGGAGEVVQLPATAAAPAAKETFHEVTSPIVGTFYDAPSPGAASFVKIGDVVEAGQVLCIVEAMKLMNEIEADIAGEIVQRIAVGGQPVEYGQPLFAIRPR